MLLGYVVEKFRLHSAAHSFWRRIFYCPVHLLLLIYFFSSLYYIFFKVFPPGRKAVVQ